MFKWPIMMLVGWLKRICLRGNPDTYTKIIKGSEFWCVQSKSAVEAFEFFVGTLVTSKYLNPCYKILR